MILDLLRHGEPQGGRMYRGHLLDDPLTEKGWRQMQKSTAGKNWDLIATSPMLRCIDFAKHLSDTKKIPLLEIDDLKEIGFGVWQGKSADQIGQDLVDQFKSDPIGCIPQGAEKLENFKHRIVLALEQIKQQTNQDDRVLIVAHAGVIRMIKSNILNLPIEKMFTIEVIAGSCERFEV